MVGDLNGRDEPISSPGQSFDEAGLGSGIAEGLADLVDRRVYAVIEVHERTIGPQSLMDFPAGHQFAGTIQQHQQHLQGLSLQWQSTALFAQFLGLLVHLKYTETKESFGSVGLHLPRGRALFLN